MKQKPKRSIKTYLNVVWKGVPLQSGFVQTLNSRICWLVPAAHTDSAETVLFSFEYNVRLFSRCFLLWTGEVTGDSGWLFWRRMHLVAIGGSEVSPNSFDFVVSRGSTYSTLSKFPESKSDVNNSPPHSIFILVMNEIDPKFNFFSCTHCWLKINNSSPISNKGKVFIKREKT